MASLALHEADGGATIALAGRLDAYSVGPLWTHGARRARLAPAHPADRRLPGGRLLRRRGRRVAARHAPPAAADGRRGAHRRPGRALPQPPRPVRSEILCRRGARAPAAGLLERVGIAGTEFWADSARPDRVPRRGDLRARVRAAPPAGDPLARHPPHRRGGRRQRAADRRADRLPHGRDPRVPVRDRHEAVRRGDLRREPPLALDPARARAAHDRDPARRPLRRRVRRGDRHDEGEPGDRRPHHHGPRPGAASWWSRACWRPPR